MSESLRGSKSSSSSSSVSGSGSGSGNHGSQHKPIPHKFSSIVNKVESLIHKMNSDKHHHNQQSNGSDIDKCQSTHKESKRKSKTKAEHKQRCNKHNSNMSTLDSSKRAASLDSLNNLTDADSFDDREVVDITASATATATSTTTMTTNTNDIYSDSDDAEIAHITGTTSVQVHRRIELDQLTDETIREFNEQCSSLSHDMEFYNSWQNEEELERNSTHKQQLDYGDDDEEDEGIYDNNSQEEIKRPQQQLNENNSNDMNRIMTNSLLKDANNNECMTEIGTHEWLERLDVDEADKRLQQFQLESTKPLTHIQQIVNNITQNQIQNITQNLNLNLNQIDIDNGQNYDQDISNLNINSTSQNANLNGGTSGKTRRSSVASSGSVGRMETILEEPSECKISVKEILQRFETMNKSETQSKASTLSSGVRAAAQTLNVPIERLESRQSNHREQSTPSTSQQQHNIRNTSSPLMGDSYEEQHIHQQHHTQQQRDTQQHQQPQQQQQQQHHQREQHQQREQHSRNMHHTMHDSIDHHQPSLGIHHFNGHGDDDDRLDEREHFNEHHQYTKQQSYLHSGRKISNQQQPQQSQQSQQQQQHHQHGSNVQAREQHSSSQLVQQQQGLDANYMAEGHNGGTTSPSVTRYSLLQFAMQHFRNDQITDSRSHGRDSSERASNRSYAELVKWQGSPIRIPLLRLPNDLAPLALECFDCILCYCGDISMEADLTEVKCVYTVLMHCHKYLALRDEVYCQLMKQTTANRSPCPDSTQRGWRLLSILAAYFGCSDALRPYLIEHLTSAASDRRRSCHGTAAVCLTNLRKTARCGGRKNVPSVEEVTAVSAGRSARRQIYRLPGGAERVVNTRCSTVVADVISELCALLGIESETEQQEFSLYCIVQGDAFTMPLAADEYILDVTTELLKSGQPFYLIFCRSVWHFALKRDPAPTPLYVEVLFNQVAPDYLEGLLLELPSAGVPPPEVVRDMARIAALLHRAADLSHVPAMKEIKFLLPKPALGIREIRPAQWVGLVQSAWPQIANLSPGQVKAQFLNVLSAWPLFGSSFFAVKRIWADEGPNVDDSPMWRDLILALNRRGVLFLDPNTHETLQHWPYMEVISTRKVRSEDGALFLDMKVGNLMQQRVIRVQTEQAHEISRLVRQYITMAQISQRDK